HHPVRGRLWILRLSCDPLEVVRQSPARGEDLDVSGRKRVLLGKAPLPRLRQLGETLPDLLDPVALQTKRREIRLREVAVVVTLLLGARRAHLAARAVPEHRLLTHLLAALEDRTLTQELRLERTLHAGEGVHVLHLRLRAELRLAA